MMFWPYWMLFDGKEPKLCIHLQGFVICCLGASGIVSWKQYDMPANDQL